MNASGPPLVLDLSAMWAGPLCAYLLRRAGLRVVKVEAAERPDGARAVPQFFEWLHRGQEIVTLPFTTTTGRDRLRRLVDTADVVIEASRPRALRQLGIQVEDVVAERPGRTWVSITGYGRDGDGQNDVAFGDDAAVAGDLVAFDPEGDPVFCGDAIADPLTGIVAADAALGARARGGGELVEVAMGGVASLFAAPGGDVSRHTVVRDGNEWVVRCGDRTQPVAPPRLPRC
jgi:crotonobetainyl-CoA:carnitine CoA-transferase CaiB-like acyl-CoA transferase